MAVDNNNHDALPERLVAALKSADTMPALITARVDGVIKQLAEQQFATKKAAVRQRAPVWIALAASVLLAVLLLPNALQVDATRSPVYRDVDGSGQIDIADVLALARHDPQSVSGAELDEFAARIVSLVSVTDAS